MPRSKFQALTEQMFYVLLALREERCGADIAGWVRAVTGGGGHHLREAVPIKRPAPGAARRRGPLIKVQLKYMNSSRHRSLSDGFHRGW